MLMGVDVRTVVREFADGAVLSAERVEERHIVVTAKSSRDAPPETILHFNITEAGFRLSFEGRDSNDRWCSAGWLIDDEMLEMLGVKPVEVVEENDDLLNEPNLGLATNAELLAEMSARIKSGNPHPDYRTVDE